MLGKCLHIVSRQCCSDCEPLKMAEVLQLADGETKSMWDNMTLSYTAPTGPPQLRAEIASTYATLSPDDVMEGVSHREAITHPGGRDSSRAGRGQSSVEYITPGSKEQTSKPMSRGFDIDASGEWAGATGGDLPADADAAVGGRPCCGDVAGLPESIPGRPVSRAQVDMTYSGVEHPRM
jgi:hypothetical protein